VRTLLNVIWLVLSGAWLAIGYALAGLLMCLLIITFPFGIAAFRLRPTCFGPSGARLSVAPVQAVRRPWETSSGSFWSGCGRLSRRGIRLAS
jgi:uncharacterized membrane protein YccF (DUF307 family)